MFISALRLTPLQPQRCNIDLCGLRLCYQPVYVDMRLPPSCPHLSEAHCHVFGRFGILLGILSSLVRELPLALLFFLLPPHHINANTYVPPLYFRYVLNILFFLLLC